MPIGQQYFLYRCFGLAAFFNSDITFDRFNSWLPYFVALIGSTFIMSTHISVAVPYGPMACIPQSEEQN